MSPCAHSSFHYSSESTHQNYFTSMESWKDVHACGYHLAIISKSASAAGYTRLKVLTNFCTGVHCACKSCCYRNGLTQMSLFELRTPQTPNWRDWQQKIICGRALCLLHSPVPKCLSVSSEKRWPKMGWIICEKFSSTKWIFSLSFLQIEAFFASVLLARELQHSCNALWQCSQDKSSSSSSNSPCLLLLQTTLCLGRAKLYVPPVSLRFSVDVFPSTCQTCSVDWILGGNVSHNNTVAFSMQTSLCTHVATWGWTTCPHSTWQPFVSVLVGVLYGVLS